MKTLIKTSSQRIGRVNSNPVTVDGGNIVTRLMLSAFSTPLGWIGLMGDREELISVFVGHSSRDSIRKAAANVALPQKGVRPVATRDDSNFTHNLESGRRGFEAEPAKVSQFVDEADWSPSLRSLFENYTEGNFVDFSAVEIRLPPMTTFRRRIVESTRQIRFGETVTYGELAKRAGYPGAARAVGTVMSTNRFPILIPCHRVLAAGGKLGGYTAPSGTRFKQRLLDLEAVGEVGRWGVGEEGRKGVGEEGRKGVGERIRATGVDSGRSS